MMYRLGNDLQSSHFLSLPLYICGVNLAFLSKSHFSCVCGPADSSFLTSIETFHRERKAEPSAFLL